MLITTMKNTEPAASESPRINSERCKRSEARDICDIKRSLRSPSSPLLSSTGDAGSHSTTSKTNNQDRTSRWDNTYSKRYCFIQLCNIYQNAKWHPGQFRPYRFFQKCTHRDQNFVYSVPFSLSPRPLFSYFGTESTTILPLVRRESVPRSFSASMIFSISRGLVK